MELRRIKIVPYDAVLARLSDAYQRIYNTEFEKLSAAEIEMINKSSLFRFDLYRLLDKKWGRDTYSYYIDRAFAPRPTFYKDLEVEYMDLQGKYDYLEALDMNDAVSIKEHAIQLLKESFEFQSENLRINRYYAKEYQGIDENFYNKLFATLMEKMVQEEI